MSLRDLAVGDLAVGDLVVSGRAMTAHPIRWRNNARQYAEHRGQNLTRVALLHCGNLFGASLGHHRSAAVSAFGTHIDDPVGTLDHVQIVFDHNDRVPLIHQTVEDIEQLAHIVEVQASCRLIEHVQRGAGRPSAQLGGQFDPLGLTARERGCRLAQTDVSETHVDKCLQVPCNGRLGRKEAESFFARKVQHVGDGLAPERDLQRVSVVAVAVAHLTGNVDIGQEMHLDADRPVSRTRFAAATLHIERETAWQVAAHLGFVGLTE